MIRIISTFALALFLIAGCKPKVAEMARAFVATEPHFQESATILVDRMDGYTTIIRAEDDLEDTPVCQGNQCEIDGQETTLEALLGAEGFEFLGTRRGVHLGTSSIEHFEGTLYGYGGWVQNSAFAVMSGILQDGTPGEDGYAEEQIIHSYSVGRRPGTNPVSGAASWTGVMVGASIAPGETAGDFIRGDATVSVDFATTGVDVLFLNVAGRHNGISYADMTWRGLSLSGGSFEAGVPVGRRYVETSGEVGPTEGDHIVGHFYGGDHGEVGGVFTKNSIQGAFGAKR